MKRAASTLLRWCKGKKGEAFWTVYFKVTNKALSFQKERELIPSPRLELPSVSADRNGKRRLSLMYPECCSLLPRDSSTASSTRKTFSESRQIGPMPLPNANFLFNVAFVSKLLQSESERFRDASSASLSPRPNAGAAQHRRQRRGRHTQSVPVRRTDAALRSHDQVPYHDRLVQQPQLSRAWQIVEGLYPPATSALRRR